MNSFIWRKKNITGGTGGSLTSLSADLNANNHKITNLGAPTSNNDAATKAYADGAKNGNSWVIIVDAQGNIGTLDDTWRAVVGTYTNCANNFSIENGGTYEVMFKCNTNTSDVYCSCILATNSADYDNIGYSSHMYWGSNTTAPDQSSVQFAIYLKNNQYKLYAKRGHGSTNSSWNTNTRIYVRKIAQGNIR